jgi:hypothetical protein
MPNVSGPTECYCRVDCRNRNGSRLQSAGDRLSVRFSIGNCLHPPGTLTPFIEHVNFKLLSKMVLFG